MNRLKRYWYDNEFHYIYDGPVYGDPNFFIEYTVNENPNLFNQLADYSKILKESFDHIRR